MSIVTLARWSVRLLAAAGVALVFTGLSFFLLPGYAAANFPWTVSPLVAMTIGGWTLGLGMAALSAIGSRSISRSHSVMLAVWLFCFFELVVVLAFAGSLRTDHWLTWPYVLGLVLGTISGLFGAPVLWSMRAEMRAGPGTTPRWVRWLYGAFVVVVLLLAIAALVRDASGAAVFPEPLSAFTTRSFSAFFFAIALAATPLVTANDPDAAAEYARAGLYLVILIFVAALSYLHVFDFAARPGGLLYLGAYVVTGIAAVAILASNRRGRGEPTWRY